MTAQTDDFPPVDPTTQRIVDEWARRPKRFVKPPAPGRADPNAKIDQATRAAAIQRYFADQAALEEVKRTRRMLRYQKRRDVQWLFTWAGRFIKAYDMVTTFIGTHAGGRVSRSVAEQRAWYCERCTFRRRRESRNLNNLPVEGPLDHKDRCRGYDAAGRPCDCPDDPLWRPASLPYRIRLHFFRCPLGHWDWGSYVPPPPTGLLR